MSNLMQNLKNLKDKITEIEEKPLIETVNVDNTEIIKETLRKLKETQKKKVSVNVGGKSYSFCKDTLDSTLSENIFASGETNFFYDGSPFLFKYVAEVLRNVNKSLPEDTKYTLKLKIDDSDVIIKAMLEEVFPKYQDELSKRLVFEVELPKVRVIQNENQNQNNVNPVINNNYNYNNNARYNYNY